jgi:2-iminobutanoate/2-iminopropanoate deaminase
MHREIIRADGAPPAVGAYNHAVRAGHLLFTCGQIGLDPTTGELVEGGIGAETRRVLENLRAILTAAGGDLGQVVKVNVYLADMGDFGAMNEVYAEFFSEDTAPARACLAAAALPKGGRVEMDLIAALE